MAIILKNGLLTAATLLAFYIIFYFVNPALTLNPIISFLLPIVVGSFFVRKSILEDKKSREGTISFGEAFATGFGTIALGLTAYMVLTFVHLKIDSEYNDFAMQTAKEQAVAAIEKMASFMNMEGEDFDKAMDDVMNQDFELGIGQFILGLLVNLVFPGALIALLGAAIIKKT